MIRICTDFCDLNHACPKDNFPTPFIDHILDECARSEVFSFMDSFLDIIRFRSNLGINTKLHLFVLGVRLHIERCLLVLNTGATFQRAMTLIFHDLKLIIEVFLDDLAAHSHPRVHHPYHLRLVFERCHHYLVRLSPHKCIFCVTIGFLLGFIASKEGIRDNPLKVEAILQLSPPCNIRHLQILQGMENFL